MLQKVNLRSLVTIFISEVIENEPNVCIFQNQDNQDSLFIHYSLIWHILYTGDPVPGLFKLLEERGMN